VSVVCIQL